MRLTKILTIVFFVISLGLAGYLAYQIKYKIDEEKRIAAIEARVIEKLKMIRDAQIAYQSVHGEYTSDWNKLISFIDTGRIYLIQRKEHIITLAYGADSVVVDIDTLGTVSVRDSMFSPSKYPNFDLEKLPIIPASNGKQFELFADKIERNNLTLNVFEARDIAPANPVRRAKNNDKALRVGSRTEVTTAGNWE